MRLHALILRYSRGDAVAELKPLFPPIIPAWERYLAAPYSDKFLILAGDTSTLENYVMALWMVSLAHIFEIDEALFGRLLKCIGNEGKDILLERLIAGKTAGIAKADTLVFPKIYSPLLAAIDAEAKERPRLFKAFLDNWYGTSLNEESSMPNVFTTPAASIAQYPKNPPPPGPLWFSYQ